MKQLALRLPIVAGVALGVQPLFACPFCPSIQSTLTENIAGADVVVIAKLVELPSKKVELDKRVPDADAVHHSNTFCPQKIGYRIRSMKHIIASTIVAAVYFAGAGEASAYCPFCQAVQMTFSEEVAASDAAVFVKLQEPPLETGELDTLDPVAAAEAAKAKFKVIEVLSGGTSVAVGDTIEALYFGEEPVGTEFLVMGVEPPEVSWSTPIQVSARTKEYIHKVLKLPEESVDRLLYVIDFLEDEEEALRRDSYDEFAKANYELIKKLRGQIDHDRLISWIKDEETPATRRRLYFTLLGVNGGNADLPMLKELIFSDTKGKRGLDSLIACYIQLGGPEVLPGIEEEFLSNTDSEYVDTYAVLMALRFHGEQTDVVPRERLLQAFRLMLDRPKLADLVIPDLARWEDWEVMPRLVKLFKEADKSTSWVRVPVVKFMRECPLPEADEHMKELTKIDPDAVRRANTFFPIGQPVDRKSEEEGGTANTPGAGTSETGSSKTGEVDDGSSAAVEPPDLPPAPTHLAGSEVAPAASGSERGAAGDPTNVAANNGQTTEVSKVWLIGAPIGIGLLLIGIYVLILRPVGPAKRKSPESNREAA